VTLQSQCWKLVIAVLFIGSTNTFAQHMAQAVPGSPLAIKSLADNGNLSDKMPWVHFYTSIADNNAGSLPLNAPLARPVTPVKPVTRKQHTAFFDRTNNLLLATSATAIAFDGLSTQHFLANPDCHELNPVARPFVGTRAGSAAYFGASFAGELLLMRIAHNHHHHLLERIIPMLVTGSESSMVYNNYSLSKR
jgi:hypothetical protein